MGRVGVGKFRGLALPWRGEVLSIFGLYGDMTLDKVWFFGLTIMSRVYNFIYLEPS